MDPAGILHQSAGAVRRPGPRQRRGRCDVPLAQAGAEGVDEGLAQDVERLVANDETGPATFLDDILRGHVVDPPHDLDLAKLALLEAEQIGP